MLRSFLFGVLACVSLAAPTAFSQGQVDRDHVPSNERVSLFERRQTEIDGNNVRASIFNVGQSGRINNTPEEIMYEWPKNTRRFYLYFASFWVGAEVDVPGQPDPQYLVNVPAYRENQNDPNQAWTWAPVAGYVNRADEDLGIPRSDRPQTWPVFWPDKQEDTTDPGWAGSWNGYFGKNVFNADQEIVYKMGDDQYRRPGNLYYPDSTDDTRGGLGLLVETRILAWSQILIQDAVFLLHNIKNDGTEDLDRVGLTLWLADAVGGLGDASDDIIFFDLLLDTAFITDGDGRSNTDGFTGASGEVGASAVFFLETPGNGTDRIDNDGDGTVDTLGIAEPNNYGLSRGEPGSPDITLFLLGGEGDRTGGAGERLRYDNLDNNWNGLIDEDSSNATANGRTGVGFADYIDNDGDGEPGSPLVTQEMINLAAGDRWGRWPVISGDGEFRDPVYLIQVGPEDLGRGFKDGIDNDSDALGSAPFDYLWEPGSPVVTQAMIDAATSDAPYYRYAVPGTSVILYDVKGEDLGKPYADGLDNDGDGAVDEGIDEWIDEMIDERRDDGLDNDGDWRVSLDDTGLDGAGFSGDAGEGDGVPTSGAGTALPGESNIDVTDISESDQIGITNVQRGPAGGLNLQNTTDNRLFFDYMVPGKFSQAGPADPLPGRDNDLWVGSGIFPLRAGQTERFSFAVIQGTVDYSRARGDVANRYRELLTKRENAQDAYEADYRFAQAPICPTVTAVPGNGRVTLYWDTKAEDSFDSFVADIGLGDPRDFEGYMIFRSTDPAFLDSRTVTDGFGNRTFLRPIAQYDLINSFSGFHPVAINGTQIYLGTNVRDEGEAANGLSQSYVDNTVVNGVTYYYAVASYDRGLTEANIPPTLCPISITIGIDGKVERTGPNIAVVTPNQLTGGYTDASLSDLRLVQGLGTGRVDYRIIDPRAVPQDSRYRITFEDTLIVGNVTTNRPDLITTKSFSLTNLTTGQVLIDRSRRLGADVESDILEGFQLQVIGNDTTRIWTDSTNWVGPRAVYNLAVERFSPLVSGLTSLPGVAFPSDYTIEVGPPGYGTTTAFSFRDPLLINLPVKPVNVRVTQSFVDTDGLTKTRPVAVAFWDLYGPGAVATGVGTAETNLFSFDPLVRGGLGDSDRLILLEDIPGDGSATLKPTWRIRMTSVDTTGRRNPRDGDRARIKTFKPFLAQDVFEFTGNGPTTNTEVAKGALDEIRVVPNPYYAASLFEPQNPFATGRGDRIVRFTNLPPRATIRIFTVSGRLVRTIEHNQGTNDTLTPAQLLDGVAEWDLNSDDLLTVSYGIYLYHVDAPGVGEKTGTLAIVK